VILRDATISLGGKCFDDAKSRSTKQDNLDNVRSSSSLSSY